VRRGIRIPGLRDEVDARVLETLAETLPGVRGLVVELARRRIRVNYDASRLDYQALLQALAEAGLPAANDRWSRLRGSWYQYLDGNARDNAKAPKSACCNRPPK